MAIQTATESGLIRTTGLVPAASDYTALWYGYIDPVIPIDTNTTLFVQVDSAVSFSQYIWIAITSSGDLFIDTTAGTSPTEPVSRGYHHFAYTRSGTTQNLYVDGILLISFTADTSTDTYGEQYLAADDYTVDWTGTVNQYFREYDSALTQAQIITEANSPSAVISAWSDTPLVSDLLDDSGNGRNWSNFGSGNSFITGPLPVPATNTNDIVAYDIASLDASFIQIVSNGVTTTSHWYKITGTVANQVIGFRFWGTLFGLSTTYRPITLFYDNTIDLIGSTGANLGSQVPIEFGVTYYFKAEKNSGNRFPALLQSEIILSPQTAYTAGDILIRAASMTSNQKDVYTGLPAGIIDPDAQEIINFIPELVVGEYGDVVRSNGNLLLTDEAKSLPPAPAFPDYYINLYSPSFVLLTRFLYPAHLSVPRIRTHNQSNKFYILDPGNGGANPAAYGTVTDEGVLTNLGTIPRLITGGFAANADETILFVSMVSGGFGSAIKQWDMIGLAFLSDLAATVANYDVIDILVLDDSTILALYFDDVGRDVYVKRFNPPGSVLNTYTFTFASTLTAENPRIGYSTNSPESFWIHNHLTTGFSDDRLIRVNDGTELKASLTPDAVNNQIEQFDPPLTVTSNTCPIIELVSVDVVNGSITVIKVTSPSSEHSFDFVAGGGLSPGTFSLLNGEHQNFLDLTPDSGYSIVEDAVSNWVTEYVVSNGSPNDNITVGAGQNVIVTVTNTQVTNLLSGVYKIEPNSFKTNDTLWQEDFSGTVNVAIPRPFARTGLLGE